MVATPVEKFGKDHWSMLAYVESRCVDHRGQLDKRHIRCNENTHPLHAVNARSVGCQWKSSYSTMLRGFFECPDRKDPVKAAQAGVQLLDHDDWDCMNDLEAAGYIEVLSEANAIVCMTPEGNEVAAKLRAHKAAGNHFATFTL